MVTYIGLRVGGAATVYRLAPPACGLLKPRLDLRNHSPSGMDWGYCGSGPAQLALAILADVLQDDDAALRCYQRFKFDIVAMLDRAGFTLDQLQVEGWIISYIGARDLAKTNGSIWDEEIHG